MARPKIYKPSIYNGPTLYKGDGSVYNGNGVYKDGLNKDPLIFASDDFFNIVKGSLSSSNVVESDTAYLPYNIHNDQNTFIGTKNLWYGKKKFCNLMGRSVTIDANLEDFSLQFYASGIPSNNGAGHLKFCGIDIYLHWNDEMMIMLRQIQPGAIAYNGAVVSGGHYNLPMIFVTIRYFQQFEWDFFSVVCKKNGSIYDIYLYVNGVLYFSWQQSVKPDMVIRGQKEAESPEAVISEIMLFSTINCSSDFMTYPTNNYEPLF